MNNYTPKFLFISWEQAGGKSLRFKNELEQCFSSPVDFLTKGANFCSNWGCYSVVEDFLQCIILEVTD